MKKVLKSIIFVLIFIFILNKAIKVLWLPKNALSYFYDEPKNSLDIVYIGASNVHTHFNTTLAYEQYGFTTGLLSTGNQPPTMIKYLLKESQKYQNPKLYIIDITQFSKSFANYTEGEIRNAVDNMKFSKNRIDAIDETLMHYDYDRNALSTQSKSDKFAYYFSFLKYHNSWKEISESNFLGDKTLFKSFYIEDFTFLRAPFDDFDWPEERETLTPGMENILIDLIEYIKENNMNVLFVVPNKAWDKDKEVKSTRINTVMDILKENDFEIINFNDLDDFKIDLSKELYNVGHLNIYGATKYTLYFSKLLHDNYKLPDHRNDSSYESWDKEYERLKLRFLRQDGRKYETIVEEYKEELGIV